MLRNPNFVEKSEEMREEYLENFQKWTNELMDTWIPEGANFPLLKTLILLLALILIMFIFYWIAKKLLIEGITAAFRRTKNQLDDVLIEHKVFNPLAHIMPALIAQGLIPFVFHEYSGLIPFISDAVDVYLIVAIVLAISSFLSAVSQMMKQTRVFRDKPVDSYIQLVKIILFALAIILALSVLFDKNPLTFLTAFGAMTAIILLIFKDTILGLVASIQMSANDMVRVGDWVSMPKFDADGDVIRITLATVQIQNWDKTISNVPTYAFVSDSFKNWRGMQASGGRRIKRSIYININSIRYCTPEMVDEFKDFHLIRDLISDRLQEIEAFNSQHNFDEKVLINGRHLTNIGVFRMYAEAYLKDNKKLRQDMTMMVRQLAPAEQGLPLEIYCFTDTTAWVEYEIIQSDIFDHLLAAAPYFSLQVFQNPSGKDFANFTRQMAKENINGGGGNS